MSRGTVLVLPGGRPDSWERSSAFQLANVRMRPITRRLRTRLGSAYTVAQVRYRYRGWNAPQRPAVIDAVQALDSLPAGPLVLVGHSMGGRVAAHVSSYVPATGIVALAPWWPDGEGALIRTDRLRTIHGTADTWTSPEQAAEQTAAVAARGTDATFIPVSGAGHFMLDHPRRWHDLVCDAVAEMFSSADC